MANPTPSLHLTQGAGNNGSMRKVFPLIQASKMLGAMHHTSAHARIALEELGFRYASYEAVAQIPSTDLLAKYAALRNTPSVEGTSRIGVHLRFGAVSIREMVRAGIAEQ